VIAQSPENIEKILNDIRAAAGVRHVISLPARRMFKIKVHFQAEGGGQ
jgi:5,10-methenyltetrahydromethanopterin hydrogenase